MAHRPRLHVFGHIHEAAGELLRFDAVQDVYERTVLDGGGGGGGGVWNLYLWGGSFRGLTYLPASFLCSFRRK